MKVCPKCGKQYADDANFCTNDAGRLVAMSSSAPAAAAPVAVAPTASKPVAAAPVLLGGRFELRDKVGGGATGAVHKGVDTQNGATVAIKLVAPAVIAQHAQRVERELKLLEKVQSPVVARVLASGKQGDQLWAAMEWVEGGVPVSQMVGEHGMEPERASEIAVAVGGALVEAAKVGVVHRDLAPKNVLIANGGLKLINFALPLPQERVSGVPAFVSPEVIEGKPVDQRSSTYSLGALYYFLLTGQPPFTGDTGAIHAAHLSGSAVPPSQKAAVATDIDSLVGRAMDRNPAKRYLTLKQFLDDIDRVKKGPEGGTSSTAPFGRAGAAASAGGKRVREPAATMLGVGALQGAIGQQTSGTQVSPSPETVSQAIAAHVSAQPHAVSAMPEHTPPQQAAVPTTQPIQPMHVASAEPVGSPWAAPAPQPPAPEPPAPQPPAPQPGPMTPAVQAVEAAAPAIAKVQPAAAKVQSPAMTNPGGKKTKEAKEKKAAKGKFRETMWFKKGDLDAAAAEEAAKSKDANASDKADSLPMEERYTDDGSLTTTDQNKYSLKTGHTGAMPTFRDGDAGQSSQVSADELIGEMKGGSRMILIFIAVGLLAVVGVVLAFVL
jgi:serine/threonine protein kinase